MRRGLAKTSKVRKFTLSFVRPYQLDLGSRGHVALVEAPWLRNMQLQNFLTFLKLDGGLCVCEGVFLVFRV